MNKIKTFICDDSQDILDGYTAYLALSDDFTCVGTALTSEACLQNIQSSGADILLLDIQMEERCSGIKLIPQIKQLCPDIKIIMLTSYDDSGYIFTSITNGATGYIIKQGDGFSTLNEIKQILDGNVQAHVFDAFKSEAETLSMRQSSLLYMMDKLVKLSPSEYEILQDIYKGMTYKKIAKKRCVEECTINTTASRILKKFEVSSMKELIASLRSMKIFDQNISLDLK